MPCAGLRAATTSRRRPPVSRRRLSSIRRWGRAPRWSPDGAELFYLTDDGTVWAVAVPRAAGERFGTPTRLFRANVEFAGLGRALNVSSDGGRFLLTVVPADRAPSSIVVIRNWARG